MSGTARRAAAGRRLNRIGLALTRRPARLWQLAVAALAGNLLLHQLPVLPGRAIVLVLGLAALAAVARFGFAIVSVPAIAAVSFAWTAVAAHAALAAQWPAAADGEDVELAGWIDDLPRYEPGRAIFSFRVEAAKRADAPTRVRLSWYDAPAGLEPGQGLTIVARLRTPRGLVNPGAFDYERWLFVEGYGATGYVRSARMDDAAPMRLSRRWLRFRARLVERIGSRVEDRDARALILALGLGERGGFDDRHWSVLQRTGTSHLVAVSGLHIGLIAALAYWLMLRTVLWLPYRFATRARQIAAIGCMAPATFYAALAGFALPTRRALVMLLVAQLVVVTRRRWPLATGLSLALGIVLLLDPLATLTASFWLSFGAVAVLLAAVAGTDPASHSRPRRGLGRIREFCRLQWALTLGLAPVTAWFFGQVSIAGLVVNLVAIPLFSLIAVPLCLGTVLEAMASANAGIGLHVVAAAAAHWLWLALELAATMPGAALDLARPTPAAELVAVVAVAIGLSWHWLPGRQLALLGILPIGFQPVSQLAAGVVRLTVLDVGHGLAVAIETASHRALYDAGPMYRSGFDAGAEVVGPALAALGTNDLDVLIVSHGDSDHAGGAAAIIERYPRARRLVGPDVELAGAERCLAGQHWVWDGVRFTMLHPPAGFTPIGNESSCVLKIEAAGASALLTGDIEGRAEARVLGAAAVGADVVLMPHHGSLTSSSQAFVDAVGARIAIASAGFDNRWNFPRPVVRQRWEDSGAIVLVTGDDGAIDLVLGRDSIDYRSARDDDRRYWRRDRELVSGAIALSAL